MVQIFLKTGQDYESKFLSLDASEPNNFLSAGMGTKWKRREGTDRGRVFLTSTYQVPTSRCPPTSSCDNQNGIAKCPLIESHWFF